MADEQVLGTETPAAEESVTSTDTSIPAVESSTPATEKQGSESQRPSGVPMPRFNEVLGERNELRRQIAEMRQGVQPQSQPQIDSDPEPEESKYSDWNVYNRDLAKWAGRQAGREAYRQERQRETQQHQVRTEAEQVQRAVENYHTRTAGEDENFHAAAQALRIGPVMWNAVMESENPSAIVKHLIANPAEQTRISALPPGRQLIEFGRLETKLAGPNGQPQVSQMPKPMKPVGSGKSGSGEYTQDKVTATLYPR